MSSSTTAAVGEDEMASSCPSHWLKEGNLSPLPTDTTRRRPSEAGGEGRRVRGLGAANGALGAGADVGVPRVDSWTSAAAAFAAWCAAALARDLALAAGPRWQGRRAAAHAGASLFKEEALTVRR